MSPWTRIFGILATQAHELQDRKYFRLPEGTAEPSPVHARFHNADMQGGGGSVDTTLPCFSKLRVVELSGKEQRIALDGYSRLMVDFRPRSIFDPVLRGQRSSFHEIGNFSHLL